MDNKACGTLSLVATPIGNLEDISYRAVKALQDADLIAAEDTRHTLKLLNHYNIKKPLISYFEHNKAQRGEELVSLLLQGKNIALVTDAGTPGISDPGEDIVKLAIENQITVTMIPGPTASIMGLVLSGLSCGRFCFEGFLPHERKERKKHLEKICAETRTMIFHISPHRTIEVLNDIRSILGNRQCALCRELTKKHEEILRGSLEEIEEEIAKRESVKGEMVLVVEGSNELQKSDSDDWISMSIGEHMEYYMSHGLEQKEAMKRVASDRGMTKREVYSLLLAERDQNSGSSI